MGHTGVPSLLRGSGFSIETERHAGYLRAYVFDGVDSLAVSIAMWQALGQLCRHHGVDRLLVIEDLDDSLVPQDLDALAQAMLEAGFGEIRTAFVELKPDNASNEEGEIVCLEHGMPCKAFTQEAPARTWLLYGASADETGPVAASA